MSETVTTVLTELLRLYDWRFELARMEKDGDAPGQMSKLLNQYGREKKAAWEAARRVLSVQSESGRVTVSRSLAERTEAMFRSVDPEGHIAQEWKEALK